MIEALEARLIRNSTDADGCYEAARGLAKARGFWYLDAGAVANLALKNVVERVESIPAPAKQPDPVEAAAFLGTVPELGITVSKMVKNFIAIVGDKEIANINRDDMLDFRQHWLDRLDRLEAGEVTAESANKDLIHLSNLSKTFNTMEQH